MIGKMISHYKILSKLGEGGMGVVYKAEDTKLKRIVALKFLPPELTRDLEAKKRFVQEAQAASSLDHANICTVHEINETEDGQLFISIACYEGETLKEKIAKGPLGAREALDIVQQMARGLGKAHANGIVHRDIKPANIFVTRDNEVKIVDFGVAKLTGDTRLTRTGASPGTLFYMSPEQARGEEVDHRTDIWALGVVLYEMLTGGLPFKGDHDAAVLYSVLNEDPVPITIEGVVSLKNLERIISKALAKDPSERYQSIAEMRADLETAKVGLDGPQQGSISQDKVEQRPRKTLFLIGIPVVLVAVVVIVFAVWLGKRPSGIEGPVGEGPSVPGPTAVLDNSIAVLPLANLAPRNENEFFVDGMTEELISQLAHIKALKVISRTSVMRFKNTEEPLTEIARQLGVTMILEGSVLWAGDEVRISVQLLDGVNDRHIWAKSYDSEFADILGLQRRVAKDVADQIRVELTEKEKDRLATSHVPNEKAYELYLHGRFYWNRRSVQALNTAMEYYQQAIDLDPDYALAYAGLAESQLLLATYRGGLRPDQIYPEARKMALRALELDPELAQAHVALGAIAHEYEWDWEKSERHFLRAIELNPNYATAHQWYGELLSTLWRTDEAISEVRKAQELDPLSLVVNTLVALVLVQSGDGAAGLAEFDRVLELDPSFPAAYMVGNACYYWVGEAEKSIESYLKWVELDAATEKQEEEARLLRQAYEAGGDEAFYRTAIAQLIRMYEESYVRPTWIMRFFCALGEPDSAMVWLERGYDEHTLLGFGITVPHVEVLYDNPRFTDLLKRMRLAHWWEEAGVI